MTKKSRARAVAEIQGARLGDKRREGRLVRTVARLADQPGASIPQAMVTAADLEGAYGLLENDAVRAAAIHAPHTERTRERCTVRKRVLFLHDSTLFGFGGTANRAGLGRVNDGGQGFLGHFCLAVTPERVPLGVPAFETLTRHGPVKDRAEKNRKKPRRESQRWARLALKVGKEVGDDFVGVHVMDSEADDFEVLAELAEEGEQFIIRAAQDRRVLDGDGRLLFDAIGTAVHRFSREVDLSERLPKETKYRSKRNQPRRARKAKLEIRTKAITIARPANTPARKFPDELTLNFVHVREVDPPKGEEPVEWLLVTNEPIETRAQVAAIVDAYRARWMIEEFFKALKTGCAFEKAQLESRDALERFLAMLIPIAWQLLLFRALLVDSPDAAASTCFSDAQLKALRLLAEQHLPKQLSVADAVLAVAGLGGHIKSNGTPGWQVLGRGMHRLTEGTRLISRLEKGRRSDQS